MLFHRQYNNVLIDDYVRKLRKLNMNCIVYGKKSYGKKTIIETAFPEHEYVDITKLKKCENIYETQIFTNVHYVVIDGIDKWKPIHQKKVAKLVEIYSSRLVFLLTSTTSSTIINELKSRCVIFPILPPKKNDIITFLSNYAAISNDQIEYIVEHYDTLHDIALAVDYFKHGITPQLYKWKSVVDNICKNLQSLSHTSIRDNLYKISTMMITDTDIIKEMCNRLLVYFPSFAHNIVCCAAFYQHLLASGNKNIFYIEAFLYKLKEIIK
jgi:hypothetical protein